MASLPGRVLASLPCRVQVAAAAAAVPSAACHCLLLATPSLTLDAKSPGVHAFFPSPYPAPPAASPYPEVGKTFSIITARVRPGAQHSTLSRHSRHSTAAAGAARAGTARHMAGALPASQQQQHQKGAACLPAPSSTHPHSYPKHCFTPVPLVGPLPLPAQPPTPRAACLCR